MNLHLLADELILDKKLYFPQYSISTIYRYKKELNDYFINNNMPYQVITDNANKMLILMEP